MDLLAIDFDEAEEIRRRVIALGFQPQSILLAASHTHCSPTSIDFGYVQKSIELGNEVVNKAEKSVTESIRALATGKMRIGFPTFPHSMNRRQVTWFGRAKLGVNLKGPVDHQLASLLIETSRGDAILVAYGCHPVIAKKIPETSSHHIAGIRQTASSYGITASFFLNGALGDVNPYDRNLNRPLGQTEHKTTLDFGNRIAREAFDCLSQQKEI